MYIGIMQGFKHQAFIKWRDSGYRDFEAHKDFIYWYERCQKAGIKK